MKIKSVKITGFRAFEKEEDSTFDFTKNGEIVNFASIYAPNGFGKTSFYDAVEWGITKKIQRFDRMVDFEKVRKDNNAPLLLNKSSSSGKIIIETSSQTFENAINNRKVYKFKQEPTNKYFQNQILTQDLIDAFLKEEKADKRYENFLEIDHSLKKYDLAYKKIIRLIAYINNKRKDLNDKKKEEGNKLQNEIDFKQEFKKFDEINEVIRSLNEEQEDLNFIDQNLFNQTSYDNLSRNINIRLSSLEEELITTKLRIDSIVLARDGEESEDGKVIGGILSYLDNRDKISKFDEQITELKQIINWLREKERISNKTHINDKDLKKQQNRLERALNIEKQFEQFQNIEKEIDGLQKDIAEYKETLLKTERTTLNAEKEKNDVINKINELKKSIEVKQSKLNNLPTRQKQFELTSQTAIDLKKVIDDLAETIADERKKLENLEIVLSEFDYYESKINDEIELLLEFNLFDNHKKLITDYTSAKKNLQELKQSLQKVQSKIDNQNELNNELSEFINLGLELVNKSQSSDCPLCNQNYNSFEKLSKNILSNKSLKLKLKLDLEEKVELESKIKDLVSKLSIDKEKIKKTFLLIKQPYSLDHKNIKNTISKLDTEITIGLEKLNSNQSTLNEINLFLGDSKNFKSLSSNLKDEISNLDRKILELYPKIKQYDDTLLEKEMSVNSSKENLETSELNLLQFQSSTEYKQVTNYFVEELNTNEIKKDRLSERISDIRENIGDLTEKKKVM